MRTKNAIGTKIFIALFLFLTANLHAIPDVGSSPEIDIKGGMWLQSIEEYDFDNHTITTNTDATFEIHNTGDADLILSGSPIISITGANADQFSVQEQPSSPVASGDKTTFKIRFSPTSGGEKTALISIANNDADENPKTLTLKGTGDAPPAGVPLLITVSNAEDSEYNGDYLYTVDDSYGGYTWFKGSLVIRNVGWAWAVEGSTNAFHNKDEASASLPPKTNYEKWDTGAWKYFPSNIELSYGATSPEMELKQGSTAIADNDDYDFGSKTINSNTDITFTIHNTGDATLTLSGSPIISITGTDADQFSVQEQPSSSINADDSTTFKIRFSPTSLGEKMAAIAIGNDDGDENPYHLTLKGTATGTPDIEIEQDEDEIANGGDFDFGDVLRDSYSEKEFDIYNEGEVELTLSGEPIVQLTGDDCFSVEEQPVSSVEPESETSFLVKFAPTALGDFSAQVSISNNDEDNTPFVINLTGTCVYPAIQVSCLDFISDGDTTPSTDDGTDFGLRHVPDDSLTRTFTIKNNGTADLALDQSGVQLTGSSDFKLVSQIESDTLSAGDSTSFSVRYTPTSADTAEATVSLSHNADDSPYTFALRGVGGMEEIQIVGAEEIYDGDMSPSADKGTDFGSVYVRETQDTLYFTVTNTGNWPLEFEGASLSNMQDFGVCVEKYVMDMLMDEGELQPDSSVQFGIVFDPTSDGLKTSVIEIESSDANESTFSFMVQGNGTWLGAIRATVWYDKNANRTMDNQEVGIQDVMVYLDQETKLNKGPDTGSSVHAKHLTNGAGQVKFDELQGGEYAVRLDESTLPEGWICTTGQLTQTVSIGKDSQINYAFFGFLYEDSTAVGDHNDEAELPWNGDLTFLEGSPDFVKEPWSNAVDKSVAGWGHIATIREDKNGQVWASFQVVGGPCQFDRMTIIPMLFAPGIHDYSYRWVQELMVYTSTTGADSADFNYAATIKLRNALAKGWEREFVYELDHTFIAKYIKIVITMPDLGPDGWRQLAEIALGELDIMPMFKENAQEKAAAIPTEYSLNQNYPNPFNPVTTISYTLPESQNVDIAVYNIKGDLVKQLVSSRQDAGVYTVNWDATNAGGHKVTTGVYIYRIRAGQFEETRKMTLVQ